MMLDICCKERPMSHGGVDRACIHSDFHESQGREGYAAWVDSDCVDKTLRKTERIGVSNEAVVQSGTAALRCQGVFALFQLVAGKDLENLPSRSATSWLP